MIGAEYECKFENTKDPNGQAMSSFCDDFGENPLCFNSTIHNYIMSLVDVGSLLFCKHIILLVLGDTTIILK